MTSGGPALSRGEWAALALAVVLAHAFYWRTVLYPSDFDAAEYLAIATDMARSGVLGDYRGSRLRTYGYPLFLLGNRELAGMLRLPWTYVVFVSQLALHLGAAALLRYAIAPISARVARIALIAVAANPFALIYTAETLTESLSLSLVLLAGAAYVATWRAGPTRLVAIALGSLALGAAAIVRPANVFALPAWLVALVALAGWQRWRAASAAAAAAAVLAFVALPMLPQLANNVRHHDKWTPLIASPLARHQQVWGIENIKYATALPPVPNPSVFYLNPFAEGRAPDPERPLAWYRRHPVPGVATLALHTFNMLDPDLVFTYARNLDPWYRRPLAVLTHGAIALALVAVGALACRGRREPRSRVVLAALLALAVSHVGLHATTAVEMRFGVPLLVLAGALAAWAFGTLWLPARASRRVALATFVAAWVTGSLVLSDWVRAQSPQIRGWQAHRTAAALR
jgi:hypothetical protein